MRRCNILILNGGGAMGAIETHFLSMLPASQQNLSRCNLICGASIGGILTAAYSIGHRFDEVSPEIVDALAGRGADVPEVAVPGLVEAGRQKDDFVSPDKSVTALGEDGDPVQADPDVAAVPQLLPVAIAVDFGILPYVAAFLVKFVPVAFVFLHSPAGMPGRATVTLVDALVMAGTMA